MRHLPGRMPAGEAVRVVSKRIVTVDVYLFLALLRDGTYPADGSYERRTVTGGLPSDGDFRITSTDLTWHGDNDCRLAIEVEGDDWERLANQWVTPLQSVERIYPAVTTEPAS